uniref:DUF559 domain-containing protein n=1 Tax=Chitinimonas sp. TaxID=1934313 RepID=UPI0035B2505F
LFQDAVTFARLGLAIVDEQHRFGVHQRLALRQKANSPLPKSGEGPGVRAIGPAGPVVAMPPQPVPPDILDYARSMRQHAGPAEHLLWQILRDHRFAGAKFRRQHPIDRYIADFCCVEHQLVIELDGSQHQTQADYDAERSAYLASQGFTVLRFWNNQVVNELEGVLTAIWNALPTEHLHSLHAPSPPAPLSHGTPYGRRPAGEGSEPHMLMMSATPIPRTLAMSFYADLDVSVIDQLPPGRTPIKTRLVNDSRREEMIEFVRQVCAEGRQAYWVCPLIEESEALELQTAIDTHQALSEALPEFAVGLVHGRLKAAEKAEAMAAFAANHTQVLVATTVIEVGVDVPNATLMVIEHAERMGLAQLHQLRGRVGRGAHESRCILLFNAPLGDVAKQRLKVIFENTDGFVIAQEDLRIRGPGEFLGARQSGVPMLRFADLERDAEILEQAKDIATELIDTAPDVAQAHLARWLAGREALLKT